MLMKSNKCQSRRRYLFCGLFMFCAILHQAFLTSSRKKVPHDAINVAFWNIREGCLSTECKQYNFGGSVAKLMSSHRIQVLGLSELNGWNRDTLHTELSQSNADIHTHLLKT